MILEKKKSFQNSKMMYHFSLKRLQLNQENSNPLTPPSEKSASNKGGVNQKSGFYQNFLKKIEQIFLNKGGGSIRNPEEGGGSMGWYSPDRRPCRRPSPISPEAYGFQRDSRRPPPALYKSHNTSICPKPTSPCLMQSSLILGRSHRNLYLGDIQKMLRLDCS